MTKEEIYAIWTPPDSPWSAWTKPVLFSYLTESYLLDFAYELKQWAVPSATDTAVIADVPGAEGLAVGLALCLAGRFRPIPVYNACPFPNYGLSSGLSIVADGRGPQTSIPTTVDMTPILSSLRAASEILVKAELPPNAPPAFLIDENRKGRRWTLPKEGWFDNRSFVTPSDFPSSHFLQQHGLAKVILIQSTASVQWDLLEVLLGWQRDGIRVLMQKPWEPWNPQPLPLKRPSAIAGIVSRFFWRNSFQSNVSGSFGEYVPPGGG